MGHHDAPGNGQSQPVATGLTVAGLVRPVKPIEEMGEFFPLQRLLDGIGHGQLEGTPLLFLPQLYFSSPSGIFQGVVQQDGDELSDVFFIPRKGEHGLDGEREVLFLALGGGLEGVGHLLCHVGNGKLNALQLGLLLLHAGEINEIIGQLGQAPGLTADVGEPLVFSALHLCQIRVGADDGHGGLQLMAGIGDELLLLFIALRHWPDNMLGQDQQQNQDRRQPQQGQRQAGKKGAAEGRETAAAVQKNDPAAQLIITEQIAVVSPETGAVPGFHYTLSIGGGVLGIHSGDLTGVCLEHLTVFAEEHRKEAGLIRRLRGHAPLVKEVRFPSQLTGRGLLEPSLVFGKGPVIGGQHGQDGIGVRDHLVIAHQVHAPQDHQQNDGQGEHTGGDQLMPQTSDHGRSSRE